MTRPWIAVGIDGSETAREAMLWAAEEASRRRVALVIAHAGDVTSGEVPDEYGTELLREAEASVFESDATCPVTARISEENPVRFLTELSHDADLMVVGSHGLGRAASSVVGSVAFRVASHATCPVAVIPRGWQPPPDPRAPVVLGVSATTAGRTPMYFAFAQARSLGVPLLAVRAWSRLDWTGDLSDLMYRTSSSFETSQYDYLERVLKPVRAAFPDVQVQTLVCGGRVEEVLRHESAHRRLLVLGSRFTDGHTYSRLGPLTSRLLHAAQCPVVVVGHRTPARVETSEASSEVSSHA
ncbi:MAG TPA: universal stress protein [Jatrophihabitans sp.]|nr:universal stress protein [Jatrophihabitans sp.]